MFKANTKISAQNSKEVGFAYIFLLIAVVLVGVTGVGYVAYKNGQINTLSQIPDSASPTPVISEIDTSDWKTYSYYVGGFEFKYPQNLTPKLIGNGVVEFKDNQGNKIFSYNGYEKMSVTTYQNYKFIDKRLFTDSQNRTWETDMVLGEVFNFNGILKDKENYFLISLQSEYGEEADNGSSFRTLANQILSTFRFLDNNYDNGVPETDLKTVKIDHSPKSDWQTYSDTIANYKIQYPQNYKISPGTTEGKELIIWNCSTKDPQGKELCTSGFNVRIYDDYNGGSRRVWLNNKLDIFKPYYENWVIDGKNSLLAIEGNPGGSSSMYVAIPGGNRMYIYSSSFVAWDPDTKRLPDLTIHKEIISTFKFLD